MRKLYGLNRLVLAAIVVLGVAKGASGETCPPEVSDRQAVNNNAQSDGGYEAGPRLAADGRGCWVAVWWSGDDLGGTIGNDSDILFSRSSDDGTAWTGIIPLTNHTQDMGALGRGDWNDSAVHFRLFRQLGLSGYDFRHLG